MKDKYGVELAVGDQVVISQYNIFTNRTTFEKAVITRLYTVVSVDNENLKTEGADVDLINGEQSEAFTKFIIKI